MGPLLSENGETMRLGPRAARVLLWEEDARICVVWCSAAHWTDIKQSLKESFPRHCQLSYAAGRQRWSLPATMREPLEQWLAWTFTRDAVEWVDHDPVSFSRHDRASNEAAATDSRVMEEAS